MENQVSKTDEWVMPTTVDGLQKEIHLQISTLQMKADVVKAKNGILSGESPEPEKDKIGPPMRNGLIGNLQDAVDRLRNLNGYMNEQCCNLETNLG